MKKAQSNTGTIVDVYDKKLQKLIDINDIRSKELISVKSLYDEEKKLKEDVADYVKQYGPILFDNSRIEYKLNHVKKTLQRTPTIDYIRKKYGDEIADDVDDNCTKSNVSEGVWIYVSKSEDDDCDDVDYGELGTDFNDNSDNER